MYLTVLFTFFAIVFLVGINVVLINHLKEFSGVNLFTVLLWVNLNIVAVFGLLFFFGKTVYRHWVEVKTSDLKRKLLIIFLSVFGLPFVLLTGLAIVGKTSYMRVFTDETLKQIVLSLEGIDEDIKSIKNLSPSERERLNQKLKRLERETANLRQIVKQQKLVLINFVSTFVLIALATLLGLTLFGLFLVRVISTPVEVFSKAMKKLSAGDFSAKVNPESFPIKQVKELKEFAADYNRTVDRLKELYDNLEREKFLFETVFDKVSTGVALFHTASGELIKANRGYKTAIGITDLKTLREWVKDKDYYRYEEREITPLTMVFVEDLTPFVINKRYRAWKEIAERLAHDIKNPLNAIQLQIELLERIWEKNPERFEETFKTVKKDITKQIDYISGLIDAFNNLSSQDVEIKKEFFSLRQLLFEVKKVFEDDRFKVFVEIPPLWIRGDRAALKRVFENLVKNAREVIEKTKGAGFVRIRAEGNKIHVIDDGPGIPPDKVDKIFLPFVSTKGKGRGLGLFNVKRIVEEHGWSISVVPPRKGEGAHFVIEVDPRDVRNKLPRSG